MKAYAGFFKFSSQLALKFRISFECVGAIGVVSVSLGSIFAKRFRLISSSSGPEGIAVLSSV